jgi:hypothetical protein
MFGGSCLPAKPFFETGTAKRVQTVEERERLVEQLGANLDSVSTQFFPSGVAKSW